MQIIYADKLQIELWINNNIKKPHLDDGYYSRGIFYLF